jgi:hypothetical protein
MAFSSALADASPPPPSIHRVEPSGDIAPSSASVCRCAYCGRFMSYWEVLSHPRMPERT